MRLNDAVIENQVFDDVECASMQEFIDKLLNAKDLVADVYVNTHRVCSGRLSLAINNNWIIGCVDERLSLAGSNVIENIAIRVHQTCDDLAEATYILTSYTVMNQIMEGNDVDADLYFKIVSTVPNCTTKCFVPDSVFRSLGTEKLTPVELDTLPTDPTVAPDAPNVSYVLQEGGKGYMYAKFTMSNVDYDPEENYTWTVSPSTAGEFDMYGNGNTAQQEFQHLQNPAYLALVEGNDITVTVVDEQENILFENVTATKTV